jgi:hypothetical protein
VSTGNAVGVALSAGYGVLVGILALAQVRGRTWTTVAMAGAAFLGLYWSFIRQAFS